MLTLRDTNNRFQKKGDFLKMITKKTKKSIMLVCRKKNYGMILQKKCNSIGKLRVKSLFQIVHKKIPKSPGVIVSASGVQRNRSQK